LGEWVTVSCFVAICGKQTLDVVGWQFGVWGREEKNEGKERSEAWHNFARLELRETERVLTR